ncbi:hypothetical protein [Burkholderia ubonensis]|uniref:hypothetical protein n=1 Tax=Burkholderia ubonensis TaxID=101571 RepID=UPI0012FB0615|nr:hypothetical protein [Burkholderia ubonensis]
MLASVFSTTSTQKFARRARDTLAPTVSIGMAVLTDTLPGEPCSTVGSKRFKSSRPDQIKTRDSISCRGFFIFRLRIRPRSILSVVAWKCQRQRLGPGLQVDRPGRIPACAEFRMAQIPHPGTSSFSLFSRYVLKGINDSSL